MAIGMVTGRHTAKIIAELVLSNKLNLLNSCRYSTPKGVIFPFSTKSFSWNVLFLNE
jgi:hypothetical protein